MNGGSKGRVQAIMTGGDLARYRLAEWLVDPQANCLTRGEQVVQLEAKTMDVLAYLLAHADRVVPTEELLSAVWPDRVVEQSTVHRRINQIRTALEDDAKTPTFIKTIVRRGYQVVASVSVAESVAAPVSEPDTPSQFPASSRPDWRRPGLFWSGCLALGLVCIGTWLLLTSSDQSQPAQLPGWQKSFADTEIIAVLPFEQMVQPGLEYLGPALRSEISQRLHRLDPVTLIADFSATKVVQHTNDVREIGALLGADYVVEGRVRSDGTENRVTISLSETNSGKQVWQHEYEQKFDEVSGIFALYDEIARSLALQLGVYLDRDLATYFQAQPPPTGSIEAYNLTRRAYIAFIQQRFDDSIALSESAIALDPDFHLPHQYRGLALWVTTENGESQVRDGFEQARLSFERVIELAPELGGGYTGLAAMTMRLDLDFPKSKQLFEQALQSAGPEAFALRGIAELYFNNGRYAEALALHQRAAEQNPLDPDAALMIARTYARMGEVDKAMEIFEQAMPLSGPGNVNLHTEYYRLIAEHDLAKAQQLVAQKPPYMPPYYPSFVQAKLGNFAPRKELLAQMVEQRKHTYVSPWLICMLYLAVEDYQSHIEWFQLTLSEERPPHYLYDGLYGQRPDYWQNLQTWAGGGSDQAEQAQRRRLVSEHQQQVAAVMKNMWLD